MLLNGNLQIQAVSFEPNCFLLNLSMSDIIRYCKRIHGHKQ